MALRRIKVPVPLGAGLDQGTDEFLIKSPKLADMVNGHFGKLGIVERRLRLDQITTPTGTNSSLFKHGDALGLRTRAGLQVRAEGPESWRDCGIHGPYPSTIDNSTVYTLNAEANIGVYATDVAHANGFTCFVWREEIDDSIWAAVQEDETGTYIYTPRRIYGEETSILGDPRVGVSGGSSFIISWVDLTPFANELRVVAIDTTAFPSSMPSSTVFQSSANLDSAIEIANRGSSHAFLAATFLGAVSVYAVSTTGTNLGNGSVASSAGLLDLYLTTTNRLFVHYQDLALGPEVAFWDLAGGLISGSATGATGVDISGYLVQDSDAGSMRLISDETLTYNATHPGTAGTGDLDTIPITYHQIQQQNLGVDGSPGGGPVVLAYHFQLLGKPEYDSLYGPVVPISWVGSAPDTTGATRYPGRSTFKYAYWCVIPSRLKKVHTGPEGEFEYLNVNYLSPTARFAINGVGDITHPSHTVTKSVRVLQTSYPLVVDSKVIFNTNSTGVVTGPNVEEATAYSQSTLHLTDPDPIAWVESNQMTEFAAGIYSTFDGTIPVEGAHHQPPEIMDLEDGATFGNDPNVADTPKHEFRLIWLWRDNKGNLYRSTPGPSRHVQYDVPSSAGFISKEVNVDFTIPAGISHFFDHTLFQVYYLTNGVWTAVSPVEYAWEHEHPDRPWQIRYSIFLDKLEGETTYAPANLRSELLYTETELDVVGPPTLKDLLWAKDRLIGISADDTRDIWYSKPIVEGLAPEFSDALVLRTTTPAVALASMDDKVVIFTEESIFYIFGDGPNALGQGAQFVGPKEVQGAIGCVNKNSVVEVPQGLMFQSQAGIFLLNRGLTLEFVGRDIEDTTAGVQIQAAVRVPEVHEVRFLTDGDALVFNYALAQWSKFQGDDYEALDGLVSSGSFHLLNENGVIYREGDTPSADDDFSYTTGWIDLDGIQGFKRVVNVLFLGRYYSDDLSISIAYDYEDDFSETHTWLETPGAGDKSLVGISPIQIKVKPRRQKCQSIRFKFEASFSALLLKESGEFLLLEDGGGIELEGEGTDGAGFTITGITFDVGVLPGVFRHVPPTTNQRT